MTDLQRGVFSETLLALKGVDERFANIFELAWKEVEEQADPTRTDFCAQSIYDLRTERDSLRVLLEQREIEKGELDAALNRALARKQSAINLAEMAGVRIIENDGGLYVDPDYKPVDKTTELAIEGLMHRIEGLEIDNARLTDEQQDLLERLRRCGATVVVHESGSYSVTMPKGALPPASPKPEPTGPSEREKDLAAELQAAKTRIAEQEKVEENWRQACKTLREENGRLLGQLSVAAVARLEPSGIPEELGEETDLPAQDASQVPEVAPVAESGSPETPKVESDPPSFGPGHPDFRDLSKAEPAEKREGLLQLKEKGYSNAQLAGLTRIPYGSIAGTLEQAYKYRKHELAAVAAVSADKNGHAEIRFGGEGCTVEIPKEAPAPIPSQPLHRYTDAIEYALKKPLTVAEVIEFWGVTVPVAEHFTAFAAFHAGALANLKPFEVRDYKAKLQADLRAAGCK
ncbi:MAG TPA: hypothetical protein VG944_13085 [Fimbriimonas sp.]|nr:hypothetical protein [Fimbriimonas sp.]